MIDRGPKTHAGERPEGAVLAKSAAPSGSFCGRCYGRTFSICTLPVPAAVPRALSSSTWPKN